MPQPRKKYYSKPIRKRKHYSGLEHETESDESDSYVEVRRRPKQQKKRIVYEDELDGIHEYEPQSPSEDEEKLMRVLLIQIKTIRIYFRFNSKYLYKL